MIISRTPFRLSFFGGASDYPTFYEEHGGAVLSTSINKYCYVNCRYLPPFFDCNYRIRYRKQEEVLRIEDIEHPTVRECLRFIGLKKGVEIQHNADLPAMSGLGSSSAFTVGLLNVLNALKGIRITKEQLALDAIHVEQDLVKESVGSQDQTIATYGGFNKIEFSGHHNIVVNPIIISQDRLSKLQSHLMLFFTGTTRISSELASELIKNTPAKESEIKEMRDMVDVAIGLLKGNIMDFGLLLNEFWKIKRTLTKQVTNTDIDCIYQMALGAGATGGKVLGVGGGGFMLFFIEPHLQQNLKKVLKPLLHVPFKFDNTGSQIIYYNPENNY
jgi:D-glycero-alpha-D-manno-heptose-7-phosphate kinase